MKMKITKKNVQLTFTKKEVLGLFELLDEVNYNDLTPAGVAVIDFLDDSWQHFASEVL